MSVRARQRYLCLDCNNAEIIECTKEEHKEEIECPKCKGKLVDVWNIEKYLPEYRNKVKEPTMSLDNIESEGIIGCYAPIRVAGIKVKEAPLLQIELDTYGSVPRVFHKGEEIELKQSIQFDWETSEDTIANGPYIKIQHIEKCKDRYVQKTIEYRDPLED
ncbi:hypothetical protein [Cytobacillus kochii]|uniref:hypothetical protein n=1 Tax=Cytobacillus kochii TaxID=859143 RepID=UPI00402ACBBF